MCLVLIHVTVSMDTRAFNVKLIGMNAGQAPVKMEALVLMVLLTIIVHVLMDLQVCIIINTIHHLSIYLSQLFNS